MSEELKACPFCGELNGAVCAGDMGNDGFFVDCTTPRCRTAKGRRLDTTAMYGTIEQAVKAWNTRAAPPPVNEDKGE
jgi:hypothetical protein